MDLGRPVARHLVRRPHEVIELDELDVTAEESVTEDAELSAETPER